MKSVNGKRPDGWYNHVHGKSKETILINQQAGRQTGTRWIGRPH